MRRKGVKYVKGQNIPCPKCNNDTTEVKELSMSSKEYFNISLIIDIDYQQGSASPLANGKCVNESGN